VSGEEKLGCKKGDSPEEAFYDLVVKAGWVVLYEDSSLEDVKNEGEGENSEEGEKGEGDLSLGKLVFLISFVSRKGCNRFYWVRLFSLVDTWYTRFLRAFGLKYHNLTKKSEYTSILQ
jgi:hypothetical protein